MSDWMAVAERVLTVFLDSDATVVSTATDAALTICRIALHCSSHCSVQQPLSQAPGNTSLNWWHLKQRETTGDGNCLLQYCTLCGGAVVLVLALDTVDSYPSHYTRFNDTALDPLMFLVPQYTSAIIFWCCKRSRESLVPLLSGASSFTLVGSIAVLKCAFSIAGKV